METVDGDVVATWMGAREIPTRLTVSNETHNECATDRNLHGTDLPVDHTKANHKETQAQPKASLLGTAACTLRRSRFTRGVLCTLCGGEETSSERKSQELEHPQEQSGPDNRGGSACGGGCRSR